MNKQYLFSSARLGFRNWEPVELEELFEMNTDEKVMEFFPALPSRQQTMEFMARMQQQYVDKGFCYFAVDRLDKGTFIGFIGISEQHYPADFTPCVDIGWRIKSSEWNQGYASEGAQRCLEYAQAELQLKEIYSVAPKANLKSEHIMKKIGLIKQYEFDHPLLLNDARLKTCVLYKTP